MLGLGVAVEVAVQIGHAAVFQLVITSAAQLRGDLGFPLFRFRAVIVPEHRDDRHAQRAAYQNQAEQHAAEVDPVFVPFEEGADQDLQSHKNQQQRRKLCGGEQIKAGNKAVAQNAAAHQNERQPQRKRAGAAANGGVRALARIGNRGLIKFTVRGGLARSGGLRVCAEQIGRAVHLVFVHEKLLSWLKRQKKGSRAGNGAADRTPAARKIGRRCPNVRNKGPGEIISGRRSPDNPHRRGAAAPFCRAPDAGPPESARRPPPPRAGCSSGRAGT